MGEQLKMQKIKIEKEKELDKNKKNFRNVEVMLPRLKLTIFVKSTHVKVVFTKIKQDFEQERVDTTKSHCHQLLCFCFFY